MAESKSKFQLILLVVFSVFGVLAMLIFAGAIKIGGNSSTSSAPVGEAVFWGTVPPQNFGGFFDNFNSTKGQTVTIKYVYKDPSIFDHDLIEALASGVGPDIILLPNDYVIRYADKLYPLPEASYSLSTFQSSFISEANVYVGSKGILGLPVSVDPIVMYYNQSLLDSSGISLPPTTWDGLVSTLPTLNKINADFSISQSGIALGTFQNVNYYKDILSLLMLQLGSPMVSAGTDGKLYAQFDQSLPSSSLVPGVEALKFYTSFSDPANAARYSWNSTMPNARDMFLSGKLAYYVGYASELFYIQAKNPNLDFNVTMIPQLPSSSSKVTFGKMNSVAVLKSSKNIPAAFQVAGLLSSQTWAKQLAVALSLPPARRDLLAEPQSSPYIQAFYRSALVSRGWYNPSETDTLPLFKEMISDVQSGKYDYLSAVANMNRKIQLLLDKSSL